MQTRNKYAMMVDAMVNDIFGFLNDVCKMKSIFVFSDLMMAKNRKVVYGVGKVFLMIKKWTGVHGFTNALSLYKVVDNGTHS
jgi:hypothetical protein